MKTMVSVLVSFASAALAISPAAIAQHAGDIGLGIVDNRITTGVYQMSAFVPGQRVFGSEFGELFPSFTDNPGFDSPPGTFPAPSSIRFNVLSAVRQWDGLSFSTIAESRISIGFGPITPVLTPLNDDVTPGFGLAVASNGEWHRHLQYTLQSPATDGIYLLELNFVGNAQSTQESLPFWLVFNQNRPSSEHDAAIMWANANLVQTGAGLRCSPADVADDSGEPLPSAGVNNGLTEGDYNLFFANFFDANLVCDIAFDDGTPLPPFGTTTGPNNGVTEADYNVFFSVYFDGC
jgi:hypothetical protein